jgi:tripartite-type tricarboxylate transporter receptor subunit TctC
MRRHSLKLFSDVARTLAHAALIAAAVLLPGTFPAAAQTERPITLIVPFAVGGPTDIVARLAAEGMSRELRRTIIVENVGGAGGAIGTLRAAGARPDGSTMVLGQMATHALTPLLNANAGYDPVSDFEAIGLIANAPMVLAARNTLPGETLAAFRDHVRANAGRMSFGHAGLGATSQVACELFNLQAEAMQASVPYRGTAPALADLAAGQIDFVCDQITSVAPFIRSGVVRGVTIMARERSPVLPDVPSSAEQGFPELSVEVWNGLLFPKGTPRPLVDAANAALKATLGNPETARRLIELGASSPDADGNTPEAFRALIEAENTRWSQLLNRLR